MKTSPIKSSLQPLALLSRTTALLFAITCASTASATIELGQPYRPAGENYTITALQNLTPLTLDGGMSTGTNVNVNLAFQGGFGVNYTNALNQRTDFGIGLYDVSCDPGIQTATTGLSISFDHLVSSHGLSATLGNFGIQDLSTDFSTGNVAPTVSIYGTGGLLLGNFSASQILADHALSLLSSNDPIAKTDLWKLNLDALIGPNLQVSGFTVGADTYNGSGSLMTVNSDPYFLVSVTGCECAAVPEPGSAFLILSAGIGTLIITRRRSLFSAK